MRWHLIRGYPVHGYCTEDRKMKNIYLHRLITNCPKGLEVDHVNGNPLDNRKFNLRVCTHAENMMNLGKPKNNTSGYKGISWVRRDRRWAVHVYAKGKHIYGGYFTDIHEAVKRYGDLMKKHHGEFTRKVS